MPLVASLRDHAVARDLVERVVARDLVERTNNN